MIEFQRKKNLKNFQIPDVDVVDESRSMWMFFTQKKSGSKL